MPDQIEQYYNYLKGAGADVAPTLQSFRKTLADDKTAKQYYEYLRQNKFDAPDTYESFAGTLGIKKKVGGAPSGLTSEEQNKYNLILQKQQEFMRSGGKQPAKQDNLVLPQPIQKIKTAEQQDGRTVLQKDKDARGNKETALQIQKRIIKEQTSKPGMPAVAAPEPVVDGLNVITDPDEILGYNLRNPEKNKVQVKYEQEQQKKKETEELIEQAQADVFYNTPAGKFYYNIFKPLAKAGGAGLANLTSGTVRTAGDIIGADEITGEWADAIYDYIHPDKRWTEEKTNWMGKTPTPLQGNLFNDGKLNAAKIVPSTVETLTNMAWLFGTAAVGNAAGAGSVPSLIGASYINTQSDYREAGKQAGLKGEALDNFTTMSAGLTSLLEAFSPNKLITGGVKTKLAKEYAEYLAKGYTSKLAFKQASKQLAKEITTENIQEISQGAGDKMVRLLFDKTSEKPLFNDDLSWDGIKDELFETMVLTTFSTGALSTPGAIRNSRPSTFEKSAWYNVAQNPEQFNSFINKQVQEGKVDLPKMQVLTDNYNKYRGAVEQAKQFGFSEHQAVEAAWQIFKGRELDNEYKRIANNPVLKEAVGNEIKEEQKQTGNEVKRIGLGIPDVGGELSGGEVVQIVNHIGDKLGAPTVDMQERIGANEYRVEEIDLKNLYETDAGFKDYVENYDRKEKNKDGLIVPAIMAKDGTIEDGKSRLAQQYINGETKAKVFKPLITNENQKEGQEELLNAPENTAQQQPVAAKPKQVVLPQQQEYKGRRLKVVYDGNKRVVKAKNGKVIKQDSPEAKRILRQHEDNYNYNFGQPAATEQMPENIAPEQAGRWIAENSNNPAEVAGLYLQEPKQTRFRDKKEELIAEYGIGKFASSDFAGVDDKANITAGMAKSYFAGKGNAAVQGIDAYAKELSDHYGIEFTPQDVADFIKRFPNREFTGTDRTETAEAAAQRFEELTGIPLTDRVAAMAAAQFAPEELVNEARQEEDAEAERPLTEDEILEINSLLQQDFENSDNLDTFTDDETGTLSETDTAADAQPETGAAAESGSTPVQEGGEQQSAEQDEEIYEQNDDDLIGSLAAELENELNNPTELGTGGFASETKQYDAAILRTNEQSTTAFGNLSGLSASAIERSLEATGRVLWVEYPKQQGDGIAEQQPVPISYKRAADARQLGGGVLLAGDQDYSGATLQNIRQEFGTGSEQFKYELSHVLATRLLQPGNFTGKLLRSNKALSAVDIILDNNPNPDSYFLIYNSAGFIKINMAAAAKRYELLGEQAFWPYAETALQEEVIHAVSDVITTEAEWETIYNELTPDEVASIKELYDKDDLTNKQVAGEYVRMMVQEKVFGVTTELFTLRSTQGMLNTFKKLLSYLKGVFAGNPNRVSKEVIERVERAVREMNAEVKAGVGKLGELGTGRFDDELGVDIVDGFYSSLEKRLADMKPVKIPPKQWKERLKSQEAEFTGLNAWLDSKKESVSKEEVQQFLKDNRIEIREVRLGEKEYSTQWEKMKDGWKRKIGNRWTFVWEYPSGIYGQGPSGYQRKFNSVEEAKNHFDEDDTSASSKPTKYFQYQLPGDKSNYKEVLVTLPSRVRFADKWAFYKSKGYNKEAFDALPDDKKQDLFIEFKAEDKKQRESSVADFKSSHFDEPNILVHLRMNTRTDADGNKVLFIEEVQSDWGQKGKKEGFDNKELEKERNTLLDERRNLEKKESENIVVKKVGNTGFVNDFQTTYKNEDLQKSINQRYKEIDDRILKINSQTGITPSAPFVTDTNSWVKLGLKVALKEAIRQGADKIAWTTGEQQNERYDLSKQVDEILYSKNENGTYDITATRSREIMFQEYNIKPERLEDYIGKEVANKVVNGEGIPPRPNTAEFKTTLKGEDLKVGGKGMKGFYGNPADGSLGIVGNVAKSLFKQPISTTKILLGNEKMRDAAGELDVEVVRRGDQWLVFNPFEGEDYVFNSEEEAWNYADELGAKENEKIDSTQHAVTITPEIKLAVNRGLPFEMGTGGFQSNFNNNATVENFIRRNIGKYSDATIIQAVMKATGQDEKYARGMLDIAKKPLNEQQQEQLNEEVVDENVGELQEGERARNTTRKIPELDIATVQNLSEEAVKYFQKSNAVSLDEANRFIDNKPITDVVNYLLNVKKDGLTDDKRSTLFVATINKLTAQITEAREAGDNTLAESLALNQSQLLNEYMPQTTEWGRAIQIIRLLYQDPKNKGLFADQTAKDVIKKINEDADTPLSKEEEAEIKELIEEYAKAPEGLRQAELMAKINQFAAEKVNLNVADILTSIWYAKILSGPSTHVTNISANVFNAPFELGNFAIRTAVKHKTLKHFAPMMGGFLRGLYRGFSEFGGILTTGITTQESQKFFQSPLMETLDWNQVDNRTLRTMLKNPILFSFNPKVLRYVGRMLAGSDAMLQSAGQEAVAAALGEVYATNGAKKGDLRKASDYLFNNKVDIEAAKMQAEKEGFKRDTFKNRMQYNRRVSEIINSKRAFDIFDKSKKEAAKITFNYEPKGIVARSVYNVITFGQKEIKILPFYVPFVRIVTNLVDNMMNYSPVAFVSAGIGMTKDSKGVRKMTGDERAEIFIKGLIGTSTLLALAAVAGDEEDDWFEVTANGTGDMLKNYELQKTGWRPYTITLKNGTSVSYKNTPLFPVFAAIGGARDWDKYKRKENEDASTSEEMKAAAGMFAFSIFDNSWLTGVNDLINTANITDDRGQVKQGLGGVTDKAVRKGVDVTSAFMLSNFSKSMIRYADAFNGKPLTKPDNDFERIVRDVPWVRDQFIDKQITDVWGDPVVNESWMGLSPFRMKPNGFVKDEVIDLLVKNNIWIGRPRANKELYDTETDNARLMTKDEYYKYYNRAGQLLKQKLYEIKGDLMAVDGDRESMLKMVSDAKKEANEEAFAELFNN